MIDDTPTPPPEPKPRETFWGQRIEPVRIGYGEAARQAKLKEDRRRAEQEAARTLASPTPAPKK